MLHAAQSAHANCFADDEPDRKRQVAALQSADDSERGVKNQTNSSATNPEDHGAQKSAVRISGLTY
jgi:hypothetical protein